MSAETIRILWYLYMIGTAALIGRLFATGLTGRYPAFVFCLSVALVSAIILAIFFPDPRSSGYELAWMFSEPVVIVLQLAMALEIYRRIGEHYPNLGSFGRRVLLWLTGASAIACALTLGPDLRAADWTSPLFQFLILLKRAQVTILAGVLLFTIAFYRWMNTAKCPNVKRHALIACVYFSALAGYSFAVDVFRFAYWPATTVHLGLMFGCCLAWILCFSRRGEIVTPGPKMSPARYHAAQAGWQALLEFSKAVNTGQKFS